MSVITIRGQLGSGAPEIGKQVANKLRTDYVDREIIAQLAAVLNHHKKDVRAKEMPPGSLVGRIAEVLGRGYLFGVDYRGVYLPAWEMPLNDTRYLAALESFIKELAGSKKSIVIRGRGSQFILRDHPGAFHVLVIAPLELRVRRVIENLEVEEKVARKEIERFDSSRREFTKRYFKAELEDQLNYDLVINTEHLSFQDASSIIINAVSFKDKTSAKKSIIR
jgi:cytidylate kinase